MIASVEAVTVEDLHRMANEVFQPEMISMTVLGELDDFKIERSDLEF